MSRKSKYNWKSRQNVSTKIIEPKEQVTVEIDSQSASTYDASNPLVLPSQKRATVKKAPKGAVKKLLSKKQRKQLEKVVDRKTKKANRSNLLEALSKVQANPTELKQYTSITTVQTRGLKKSSQPEATNMSEEQPEQPEIQVAPINAIKGARKRCNLSVSLSGTSYDADDSLTMSSSEEESTLVQSYKDATFTLVSSSSNRNSSRKNKLRRTQSNDLSSDSCPLLLNIPTKSTPVDTPTSQSPADSQELMKDVLNNTISSGNSILITLERSAKINPLSPDAKRWLESAPKKPAIFIPVDRDPAIQEARLKLPILGEEQEIVEAINDNNIVIIAGDTGSGKTTQLPQFLYEAGYARNKIIGVTEPRRIAAIAMSKRVGHEMNLTSDEVSYLIRFEGNVSDKTKIKFMTDGVLLKEIQSDFMLKKYSVIIIDEAHERSVFTDLLIGMLSRVVPYRNKKNNPLKLVIMSATLRLSDFVENHRLFKVPPPIKKVDGRQFPVKMKFLRHTPDDYIEEAYNHVVKIIDTEPEGGILIFVTGRLEVNRLVKMLRQKYPINLSSPGTRKAKNQKKRNDQVQLPDIDLADYPMPGEGEEDEVATDAESSEDESSMPVTSCKLWTLPLYSMLSTQKQERVFQTPPDGTRLCVVATNVAETSLTIPNIKYVIDTGKTKQKLYDKITGATKYTITWTSKASADQRAGRAGRCGIGQCFRLYSTAVFNDMFPQFAVPDIQLKPVDDLYIQLKSMNIDNVIKFPFPTAPNLMQIKMAEQRLEMLGALKNGQLTEMGKGISRFPVLPRYGKMLSLSHQQGLLELTVLMVSILSVDEMFTAQANVDISHPWSVEGRHTLLGDPMVLMRAVLTVNNQTDLKQACETHHLRLKAVLEVRKLQHQLTNEILKFVPDANISVNLKLTGPNIHKAKMLRQILLSGMGDQVAYKINPKEIQDEKERYKYKNAYRVMDLEEPVFVHTKSCMKKNNSQFLIYQELFETENGKTYIRTVTAIEPEWLPLFVPNLCSLSGPLSDPEPHYSMEQDRVKCAVTATFGRQAWPLPVTTVDFPMSDALYKWFARFFLEGKIFKPLVKYSKHLLSSPDVMTRSWAQLLPRVSHIFGALKSHGVTSKSAIDTIWTTNANFLLGEYLMWTPESAHPEVTMMWPSLSKK
ncbi:kurz [Carabus blaptoides fortunei]